MSKAAELAALIGSGQAQGNRNLIINGAMNVAQRGTSSTGVGATNAVYPTVDRYIIGAGNTAGRLTMTQEAVSDLPGFAKAIKLACTTADTSIAADEFLQLAQRFEGQDLQKLKKGTSSAESVTVSFYVKGNASATCTLELQDVDNTRFNDQEFSVTTSWNRVSLTFVGDTSGTLDNDNARSFECKIWLHAGSNYTGGTHTDNVWHTTTNQRVGDNQTSFFDSTDRTFFITGWQMEIGDVATPFEHEDIGTTLAKCQRYFFMPSSVDRTMFAVQGPVDAQIWWNFPFSTEMRSQPAFTVYGADNKAESGKARDSTNTDYETVQTANYGTETRGLILHVPGQSNGNYEFKRVEFDAEL